MTPKEKAIEIYESIYYKMPTFLNDGYLYAYTKNILILFVNEILDEYWLHDKERLDYWKEVKKEIKKI